jgi:hypothetical protein
LNDVLNGAGAAEGASFIAQQRSVAILCDATDDYRAVGWIGNVA